MTEMVELTILMPCLNEEETLGACIRKGQEFLRLHGVEGEVLVADNGSSDASRKIAAELGARVVVVDEKGYGSALAGGIAAARGKYIVMGDADDSYDFTSIMPFLEKLRDGCDLVMGNRFKGGIRPGAMPALHRYLGNPALTAVGRVFFRSPAGDFHCGLRGFSRDAARRMEMSSAGMEFASEMVIKATLLGMRIEEVPTVLHPDGRSRPPHLRTWRDGWRHLRFMLLFSPNWLFLYPGFLLIALGMAAGARLVLGPITIGEVDFDVQTLLFAGTAIILGYQAALFAVFTKVFAVTEGLLPGDSSLVNVSRKISMESGVIVGTVLFLGGLGGSVYAVWYWALASFGPLDTQVTMRFIVASVVAVILGFQTVLGSFFLSILGLHRKAHHTEGKISDSLKGLHERLVFRRRARKLAAGLGNLLPVKGRILDVGCGDGLIDSLMMKDSPGREIVGADVARRLQSHIPVISFDGEKLPFESKSFDAVMFIDVLHHARAPEVLLSEAARVSQGVVLIKDHICEGRWDYMVLRFMDWIGNAPHGVVLPYSYFGEKKWRGIFAGLGLEIEVWEKNLELYPRPWDRLFGGSKHFIAQLRKPSAGKGGGDSSQNVDPPS
jgi:glycosyltransferase involved in cell wall biosynthesis/SAM-dependent methyltransferase